MQIFSGHRRAVIILGASIATMMIAHAQTPDITTDIMRLRPGEVVEIVPVLQGAGQFSWILTQDRTFIEASRDPIYRTRLPDPGTYTLSATAQDPLTGQSERHTITLFVEGQPGSPTPTANGTSTVVSTDPSLQNDTVLLPRGSRILTIQALDPSATMEADFDESIDSNQDGDPRNDTDNANTLARNEGSPLRLWFVSFTQGQQLNVRVTTAGQIQTQHMTLSESVVAQAPIETNTPSGVIQTRELDDGNYSFSFRPEGISLATVLLHWDFGDSKQSLQSTPTHRYGTPGEYTVTVEARDLRSGTIVATAQTQLSVAIIAPPSSNASSSRATQTQSSASSAPASNGNEADGSLLRTILRLLFVAIIAIGAGVALVVFGVRFFRRSTFFQKRLDKSVATPIAPSADDTLPTLEIAPPVEEQTPEPQATPDAMPISPSADDGAPSIDMDKAPDWLKQGLQADGSTAPATEEPPTAPASTEAEPPSSVPAFQAEPPAPAPSVEEPVTANVSAPATSPAPTDTELLPPWLQDDASAQTARTEPTSPAPEPAALPATPDPVAPAASPEPAPAADTPASADETPDWLKEGLAASANAPVPPEPVATPEPAPEPEPIATAPDQPFFASDTPAPEPAPAPISEPPAPEPAPTVANPEPPTESEPVQETAPQPIAMTQSAAPDDRAERERERKRRKRQRYRENVKKRQQETKVSEPSAPAPVTAPTPPVTPTPAPAPALPPVAQPAPVSIPEPAPPAPSTPAPAPVAPTTPPQPAPQPIAQEMPMEQVGPKDDDIAFLIKADSIDEANGAPPPQAPQNPQQKAV